MIPTYNSCEYLEETLKSVLAQDPGMGKMQIQVVDDSSIDEPALKTLMKLGLLNRVEYYRQEKNVGIGRNWNTCIERARGNIVHILHQDDLVLPGFYQTIENSFIHRPEIGAAFCRHRIIDNYREVIYTSRIEQAEPGILDHGLEKIASRQRIQTPAIAVRSDVYKSVGGFNTTLNYALDWEMWIRIASRYPVFYIPEILAEYREHARSETARLGKSAETIKDIRRSFLIRRRYLDPVISRKTEKIARYTYSRYAMRRASKLLEARRFRNSLEFIREGLLCSFRPSSIAMAYEFIKRFISIQWHDFIHNILKTNVKGGTDVF